MQAKDFVRPIIPIAVAVGLVVMALAGSLAADDLAEDRASVFRYDPVELRLVEVDSDALQPGSLYYHFSEQAGRRVWSFAQQDGSFWHAFGGGTTQAGNRFDFSDSIQRLDGQILALDAALDCLRDELPALDKSRRKVRIEILRPQGLNDALAEIADQLKAQGNSEAAAELRRIAGDLFQGSARLVTTINRLMRVRKDDDGEAAANLQIIRALETCERELWRFRNHIERKREDYEMAEVVRYRLSADGPNERTIAPHVPLAAEIRQLRRTVACLQAEVKRLDDLQIELQRLVSEMQSHINRLGEVRSTLENQRDVTNAGYLDDIAAEWSGAMRQVDNLSRADIEASLRHLRNCTLGLGVARQAAAAALAAYGPNYSEWNALNDTMGLITESIYDAETRLRWEKHFDHYTPVISTYDMRWKVHRQRYVPHHLLHASGP